MPLLLLDLDNTLLDRSAAFRRWATSYVAAQGAPPSDGDWLVALDRDGYESRAEVARGLRARYGMNAQETELVEELRLGVVENLTLDRSVVDALQAAQARGWVSVVVTNGTVVQQERKLRRTGLDRLVAGWVVSEGVGVRKPDPVLFELAARQARRSLNGAWVIGDSAAHDIEGAWRAGLSSAWLHRGRPWTSQTYWPTRTAAGCAQAIETVVAGD